MTNEDTLFKEFKDIQLNQNKMLRFLNKSKISDRISTKSILEKFDILSVNQINAQIKLNDMWKATNVDNYPTKIKKLSDLPNSRTTRANVQGNLVLKGKSILTQETFTYDATKLWNAAPMSIKDSASLYSAKKAIKQFVKLLPV